MPVSPKIRQTPEQSSWIRKIVAFVRELLQENILAVPGSGFHGPGHSRLTFCCSRETVVKSLPRFRRAFERVKGAG